FIGRKPDIQRKQNRTGFGNSEIRFEKPVTIQTEKCHPVACRHPRCAKSTGETSGTFAQLRVAESLVSAYDRGLAGQLLFGVAEESHRSKRYVHRLFLCYQAD